MIRLARRISLPDSNLSEMDREQFYSWLWKRFSRNESTANEVTGLVGVHEGTVLCDEEPTEADSGVGAKHDEPRDEPRHESRYEPKHEPRHKMDAWVLDSAEPPADRDWVNQLEVETVDLYFSNESDALAAMAELRGGQGIEIPGSVEKQIPQDWHAQWKAAFLNEGAGVPVPPFWRIVPPWYDRSGGEARDQEGVSTEVLIRINPGEGFGTGTHETTQLCLQLIGEAFRDSVKNNDRVLDFGSGSGILSIGAALLGAQVDAVEVDPAAIENSIENSQLNGVEDRISFFRKLPVDGEQSLYPIVVANILRPVLIEFAPELVARLKANGTLILSGLIEKDVKAVIETFSSLLERKPDRKNKPHQVLEKGEWRAVVFSSMG